MRALSILALALFASAANAQHTGHAGHDMPMEQGEDMPARDPHAGHRMPMPPEVPDGPAPAESLSGPDHAADALFDPDEMEASRKAMRREMGAMMTTTLTLDRLEWQAGNGSDAIAWDADARFGDDIDKLWLKTEGEAEWSGPVAHAEVQALWSHAIGPWFDLQAGLRYDIRPEAERAHLTLGVQGLAPYFFELDAAAFVSHKGDVTARVEAEYDQRITQRLIARPRVEMNFSAQDVPELRLGSGLTSLAAGLRLRREITREFAPYLGVEWQRIFGDTARSTRLAGDDPDRVVFVAGVRTWF